MDIAIRKMVDGQWSDEVHGLFNSYDEANTKVNELNRDIARQGLFGTYYEAISASKLTQIVVR
jgi:hypothetical protein